MAKIATLYALCYGEFPAMHERFANSIQKYVPTDNVDVVIWCNQVGKQSMAKLQAIKQGILFESAENVPKYKVMRTMFHEKFAPTTPWIIWFDDDSFIDKSDWWVKTMEFISNTKHVCYFGQPWFVHHLPGQWEFIQKAAWYKGLPPEMCKTRRPDIRKPGITFAQGAYWWLRTDIMKQINWPDVRLSHNGGDTLLGEAIRQQGLPFNKFNYGVQINKVKRRGLSEVPAGSIAKTTRR